MKFVEPAYQQFTNSSIKRVEDWNTGITATILAGSALGQTAKTITRTPSTFIDFQLEKNSVLIHPVTPGWNSLIYVLEGQVEVAGLSFGPKQTIVLTKEQPTVKVKAEKASRFIFISGQPLNEPVVQHGPFVMNTREQIAQAYDDYQKGRNGFEGAPQWKSDLFHGKKK
jgi:redox-sensitive bicupin YhaK (pirin superfamily)